MPRRGYRRRISGSIVALVVARVDANAPAAGDENDPADSPGQIRHARFQFGLLRSERRDHGGAGRVNRLMA